MMSRRQLLEIIQWMAQTVHQAYHQKDPNTWKECTSSVCREAQKALLDNPRVFENSKVLKP